MKFAWIRATTDQVIITAPGWIGAIIVTPDGDDDRGRAIIYDGESASDPQLLKIRTAAGVTHVTRFQPPLKTQRGLYVVLDRHVEEILVQVQWEAE